MSILTDLFSGGASKLVDSVGSALDGLITSKEEKQQFNNEMAKAELDFQLEMQRLSSADKQATLVDIQSARQREVAIQSTENATKLSKNLMAYITLATIVMCFSMFFVLIFTPDLVKAEAKEILFYILGVVSTILVQVYSYYFGSSSGSAGKDITIRNLKSN